MAHESYASYHHRRAPLHLEATNFDRKPFGGSQSSASSPSSAAMSPLTPLGREDSVPLTPSDCDFDVTRDPASGPQRTSSKGKGDKESEKEKRKRSRVTPEQLVHLERFFSVDRSPTAVRRKEISELLGMQERQTQIWFQNRRAKAKLHDGKKSRGDSAEAPPDTPPELTTGYEVHLHNLIHEDEPVTMIPCTDLSIGTWRRIATTVGEHDLVAYVCESKRCLTWFIHSDGYGFKMDIPFDTIVDTQFTNAAPGSGLATFQLSQPPVFYLENPCTPQADGSGGRMWKRCADWTEGMQATRVLRHDLIGSAVQLAHLLRNLSLNSTSDLRLVSPAYVSNNHGPSPSPIDPPQPSPIPPPSYTSYFHHKRSYSGPSYMQRSRDDSDLPTIDINAAANLPRGPASASYLASYHHRPIERAHSSTYHSPMFSDYPQSQHPDEYDPHPVHHITDDHGASRPYARHFYDDESRIMSPYDLEAYQRHPAPSSDNLTSPPQALLTTPFHPPPEMLQQPKPTEIITGLHPASFESGEDIHGHPDSAL